MNVHIAPLCALLTENFKWEFSPCRTLKGRAEPEPVTEENVAAAGKMFDENKRITFQRIDMLGLN